MTICLPDGETLLNRVRARVPRSTMLAGVSALCAGFATHLYAFMRLMPNHDSLISTFSRCDMTSSGRWFLFAAASVGGRFNIPFLNGLIGILALAITCMLVVQMLGIRKPVWAVLTAALIVTYPAVANTFGYMFTADAYLIATALAALGAYLVERHRFAFVISGVLLGLSLGIYQAYIFFALSLMGIRGLLLLTDAETTDRQIWVRIAQYIGALAIACVVYRGGLAVMLRYRGVALSSYQGVDMLNDFRLYEVFANTGDVYRSYVSFFTQKTQLFGSPFQRAAFALSNAAVAALTLVRVVRTGRLPWYRYALAALLLAASPLMFNGIYLLAGFAHELMCLPLCLVFVFTIALYVNMPPAEQTVRRQGMIACGYLLFAMLAVVSVKGAFMSSRAYAALDMQHQQKFALVNRIVDRVEQCPEYTHDTPIWFQGSLYNNYTADIDDGYGSIAGTIAFDYGSYSFAISDDAHIRAFARYYIGSTYAVPDDAAVDAALDTDAYAAMPVFPAAGSVRYIDGIIVAKLSE